MRRFLLRVPLVALLLAAVPALADSTVPALTAATSLTSAAAYLANGGANDNRMGYTTSVFGLSTGALTINSAGITNAMLANSATTVNGTSCTLGASCTATAAAGTLTGATLNATVVNSSLTSVGTLTSLTMGGNIALGTNSLTGNFTATGVPILSGLSAGTQVSCLGLDVGNHVVLNAAACGSGGGSSAFSAITSGTNTAAAMVVGTGATLGVSGSGTIAATSAPVSGLTGAGVGVLTWMATPTSANLASAVTDETGSGALVFGTSPTLVTPALGTPSALVLTNATGLVTAGINAGQVTYAKIQNGAATALLQANSGAAPSEATTGTGVLTALGVNTGSAGAFVVNGGALGTPSSGVATNLTGTAAGLTAGTATAANALNSATTTVVVNGSTAPTNGQVLTASSGTAASWVTPGTGGTVTSVAAGCGTSTGGSPITTTGTILASFTNRANVAATDTLVAGDCGNLVQENRATSVAVSIAQAGTAGFPAGYFTQICNINAGTATITPTTSTIGGASSFALIGGTAALPACVTIQSDGTNYNLVTSGNLLSGGALGTPSSGTLTNATGLPISTGVSGLGTGIAAALAVNTGSAGAPVLFNGAGGTPTSLTLTNATGLPTAGLVNAAVTYAKIQNGAGNAILRSNTGAAPSEATTGTGVLTALGVNTGTAGAFTLNNGDALSGTYTGTPTFSGNLTFSGRPVFSGTLTGTQVSCLGLDASNNLTIAGAACGTSGAGSFSTLTSGTNTTAAMVVGTGASLGVSGSGTITATAAPVSGLTGAGTGVLTAAATATNTNGGFPVLTAGNVLVASQIPGFNKAMAAASAMNYFGGI